MGEMFLDLDGFTGESLDYDHLDEIELIGWGWGIKNNASFNIRDVREGATHTAFDHLTITKVVDSASVTLVQFCAQGNHISKGYLACRKNTGERTNLSDFLTIEFSDLKVLSVTWPEKGAEDHGYPEIVVFQFSKFDMTYKKQANEGELYGSMNFPFSIPDQKVSQPFQDRRCLTVHDRLNAAFQRPCSDGIPDRNDTRHPHDSADQAREKAARGLDHFGGWALDRLSCLLLANHNRPKRGCHKKRETNQCHCTFVKSNWHNFIWRLKLRGL